ncbi:MAG: arginine decarboxylase, pyruvoyl-dependent [Thermoplasmata archaeon]|nr:MAG: arginine decarboxylase, pyruvoyl-dependent [Thermoplasmata archaeon]
MQNPFVPRYVFFTRGVGVHREKLASFELALRDAKIEIYNLVSVSSILPPGCKIISRDRGVRMLSPGQIVYTVMSVNQSNEPERRIAAAIGCAIPADKRTHGYISEYHAYGMDEKDAAEHAEDLAAEMLASTLGIQFDMDASYDEKREIFRIDGRIVKTRSIARAARCDKKGRWTTVVAAAIFVP